MVRSLERKTLEIGKNSGMRMCLISSLSRFCKNISLAFYEFWFGGRYMVSLCFASLGGNTKKSCCLPQEAQRLMTVFPTIVQRWYREYPQAHISSISRSHCRLFRSQGKLATRSLSTNNISTIQPATPRRFARNQIPRIAGQFRMMHNVRPIHSVHRRHPVVQS